MGVLDSLKDIYFSIEDRYYAFMDYLEEKVHIPVYNFFVNPIEDSGIPSFPFALLLFFVLLGAGFYAYMAYFAASSTSVQISVLGANNEALSGVTVTLLVDGEEFNVSASDENGVALFEGVPVGKTATVKIERDGFEPFAKSFSTTTGPFETVASLQSIAVIEPPSKEEKVSVKVLDENGVPLGGVSISYFDSISGEAKHATTDSDGVASLVGLRQVLAFEGQAAMELEFAAANNMADERYDFELLKSAAAIVINWTPIIEGILADVRKGIPVSLISSKFHNTLAQTILGVARETDQSRVVLTGGCFQNKYLTEQAVNLLTQHGIRPYWHQRIPPNDGGIALGQIYALERMAKKTHDKLQEAEVIG